MYQQHSWADMVFVVLVQGRNLGVCLWGWGVATAAVADAAAAAASAKTAAAAAATAAAAAAIAAAVAVAVEGSDLGVCMCHVLQFLRWHKFNYPSFAFAVLPTVLFSSFHSLS